MQRDKAAALIETRKRRDEDRRKSRIAAYKRHRNSVGEGLLRAALRALASIDAADMVNDLLEHKLNLSGVSIDQREFAQRVETILRAEISQVLVDNSTLDERSINRLSRRLIAQILPTRDNVLPAGLQRPPKDRIRVEEMEDMIRREAKRIGDHSASK